MINAANEASLVKFNCFLQRNRKSQNLTAPKAAGLSSPRIREAPRPADLLTANRWRRFPALDASLSSR